MFWKRKKSRHKVFGIGLNKTGTTSLKQALVTLGYKHLERTPALFKLWKKREYDQIFDAIDDFESFEDWPWPLMVVQLLERYPDAKFILTRRKSAEVWLESLKRQAEKTNPDNNPRQAIYGHAYPHGHESEHLAFYEAHLTSTRELFASRSGQLAEFCWDEGDGWQELCAFLGARKPRKPFPHANKSKNFEAESSNFYDENQRRIFEKLKNLKDF